MQFAEFWFGPYELLNNHLDFALNSNLLRNLNLFLGVEVGVNIQVSVEFIRNDCPQNLSSSTVSSRGACKVQNPYVVPSEVPTLAAGPT